MSRPFDLFVHSADKIPEEDIEAEMERFGPIRSIEKPSSSNHLKHTVIHFTYHFSVYNAYIENIINISGTDCLVSPRYIKDYQVLISGFPISQFGASKKGGHQVQSFLYKMFRDCGDILGIHVVMPKISILFTSEEAVEKAVASKNGTEINGTAINVAKYVKSAEDCTEICLEGTKGSMTQEMKNYFMRFGSVESFTKTRNGNIYIIKYMEIESSIDACGNIHPFGPDWTVFSFIPREIFESKKLASKFKKEQLKLGFPPEAVYKNLKYLPKQQINTEPTNSTPRTNSQPIQSVPTNPIPLKYTQQTISQPSSAQITSTQQTSVQQTSTQQKTTDKISKKKASKKAAKDNLFAIYYPEKKVEQEAPLEKNEFYYNAESTLEANFITGKLKELIIKKAIKNPQVLKKEADLFTALCSLMGDNFLEMFNHVFYDETDKDPMAICDLIYERIAQNEM